MNLKGKRVFIVEDDLSNKVIMQMLIEQDGARVAIDRWGVDTVERLLQSMPLDVILLDLMLPGQISGFDVFQHIRRVPVFNCIPIVAVSAADASTTIPRAQELGFAGFISKPIDFMRFTKQVKAIIDGNAIWQTSERI
jgi:two-component system chemotaxis sensor kinase CheA